MADGEIVDQQPEPQTEPDVQSKTARKNVAALSSPFKWKARTPTPHPKKLTEKEKEELYNKDDVTEYEGLIRYVLKRENEASGTSASNDAFDNKGFEGNHTDPEAPKESLPDCDPELVDQSEPTRADPYYILLGIFFGVSILAAVLYFLIVSIRSGSSPLDVLGDGNITTAATTTDETTTSG